MPDTVLLFLIACSSSTPGLVDDTGPTCTPEVGAAVDGSLDEPLPADGVVRRLEPPADTFTNVALDPLGATEVTVLAQGVNPVTAVYSSTEPEEWLGCVERVEHCGDAAQLRVFTVEGDMEIELGRTGEPLWIVAWGEAAPLECREE